MSLYGKVTLTNKQGIVTRKGWAERDLEIADGYLRWRATRGREC